MYLQEGDELVIFDVRHPNCKIVLSLLCKQDGGESDVVSPDNNQNKKCQQHGEQQDCRTYAPSPPFPPSPPFFLILTKIVICNTLQSAQDASETSLKMSLSWWLQEETKLVQRLPCGKMEKCRKPYVFRSVPSLPCCALSSLLCGHSPPSRLIQGISLPDLFLLI